MTGVLGRLEAFPCLSVNLWPSVLDPPERTIEDLQDAIDECGADIDYDDIGGVLTLEFESGSKIIFSKQPFADCQFIQPLGQARCG